MMKNGSAGQVTTDSHERFHASSCWKRRSIVERKLLIASVIAGILLIFVLVVYLLASNEGDVCTTPTCVRASMELLNYMDLKVNPCDDFYRFACGNFLQNTDLDDRSSRSTKNILEDQIQDQVRSILEEPPYFSDPLALNSAKKLYGACMNETALAQSEGLKQIRGIFKQSGGWPTLEGRNWRGNQFDWKNAVFKLRQNGINFEFFLILALQKDPVDPEKYILSIRDPSYSPSKISKEVKEMYLEYMVDVVVLMGGDRQLAEADQAEVMQFLLQLAKVSEEARAANGTSSHNLFSLSELQYAFPDVDWFDYINNILTPSGVITYDDTINVQQPLYLKKVLILIRNTPNRVLANFISWHTLQHLINYLSPKILDRAYAYLERVSGKVTREPRWTMCVNTLESRMSTVLSAAYVEKYFDEVTRQRAISMIQNIKQQFRENLYKLDWLDGKTKDIALEKLASSVEDIASYSNLVAENGVYDEVEISEDKLLLSILNLDKINTNLQYSKLREPVKEDNLFQRPRHITGINIIYSPKANVLRVPIGLFQGILYQRDRPEYMNYGALGSLIAHEIYHIIIEAEYKDLQGNLRSWWSAHSLLNYEEKLKCLSNHYGKFIVSLIEKPLNSSNTRDEDMADLAGTKVSYQAYISWLTQNELEAPLPGLLYSPNQLFWISSAIHHCSKYSPQTLQRYIANYEQSPAEFRVNGVLQNLDEFSMDFGCPEGSKMNPEQKCRIW